MGDFIYYEFRNASAGDQIRVTLDRAANVLLVSESDFRRYRDGQAYHYYGGLARRSPVVFDVPRAGNWYVVINLGGRTGNIRSNAVIFPR